ncbi:hypothetical protein STEG23_028034, partial [Scotinomys teguina]
MTVTPLGRDQDCSLKNRFLDPGGWGKAAAVGLYFIFPGICTLSLQEAFPKDTRSLNLVAGFYTEIVIVSPKLDPYFVAFQDFAFLSLHCWSQCSIAVKRHHDQGNSYERRHLIEDLLIVSESESMVIMAGSMAACWQTPRKMRQSIRWSVIPQLIPQLLDHDFSPYWFHCYDSM